MSHKSKDKQTIMQVLPALDAGGVERGTIEVSKRLVELGHTVFVISSGGYLVAQLRSHNVHYIQLNVASKNPITIYNNSKKISEIIKTHNIDIIHARSRAPAWSCYLAAQSTAKHFITTFHGIYNFSNWFKKYYNSIMVKGERVIAVSNFVKQHILDNYSRGLNNIEDKIRVIHRGVDTNYFSRTTTDPQRLIAVSEKYNVPKYIPLLLLPARVTRWKGHLTLVNALNKIKHLEFYCIMVGDLSKRPLFVKSVKQCITELKLQSKIQIFGNESNILELYRIADIVLSTSIEPEAFGRTIIEAQSMEKLVIASNIGGTAETIKDGVTGYHVPPEDADALAEKIAFCLKILGTAQAQLITSAARKSVIENFSIEQMLAKTVSVYNELD